MAGLKQRGAAGKGNNEEQAATNTGAPVSNKDTAKNVSEAELAKKYGLEVTHGPGGVARVVLHNAKSGFLMRLAQLVGVSVVIHYIWWGVIGAIVLWFIATLGPLGVFASAVALMLYVPNFLAPVQFKLGRPWFWLRTHPVWHLFQRYLNLEVVRTVKLDAAKRYVFGFHPHGILILSRVAAYGGIWETLFPGISWRVLAATPIFYTPGCRELSLWMGAIDAGKKTAHHLLSHPSNTSVMVYPGGSKEIFHTDHSSKDTRLVLESRLGFIKLAMQHGCDLVPVFVFGEKWAYDRVHIPKVIYSTVLRLFKLPLLVFWGRFFSWIPYQRGKGLGVVYGIPMQVPHIEEPTTEQLKEVHVRYKQALQDLFDTHKAHFGYGADETLSFE